MSTDICAINIIHVCAFGDVRRAACGVLRSLFATSLRWNTGGPTSHVAHRTPHGYPTYDHGGGT